MNEVIIYLLKVIAIHGILYLIYRLVFRNSARHSLNRMFLLGSLLFAFVIPLIELPSPVQPDFNEHQSGLIIWLSEPTYAFEEFELIPVRAEESVFSYWSLIPLFYALITLVLIARSIVYLTTLGRLKKHSEYIRKRWFKLFKTSHERPFSFFSNVFMPKTLFGSDAFRQILAHECVHVRQFHSVDRLLLDFVVSLFWFNPFIYLYRNALIEIHEYQADEAVVKRYNDPIGYQEILFSQLQSAQYSGLVSHFNFSMIKKRIVMMNKQRKMSGWVYALTLPVTLMVVFAFSSKEAMEPINDVGNEIAAFLGPEEGIDWPEFKFRELTKEAENEPKGINQSNEPSILPFKSADNIRMTSGFGMRMHPVEKVRKMHFGMDFSCPIGTEIIATADGEVTETKTYKEGTAYGKLLIVDHGGGYITRYAQLSEFKANKGDKVKKGDVIALSGNSGGSTAPHLHYEVRKDDKFVNPMHYIHDYNFKVNSGAKGSVEVDPEEGERINEDDKKRFVEEVRAIEAMQQIEKAQLEQEEQEVMYANEQREREMMMELKAKELQERTEIEQMEASERQLIAKQELIEARRMQEMATKERVEYLKLQSKDNDEETLRIVQELRYVDTQRRRSYEEAVSKQMIYIVDGDLMEKDEVLEIEIEEINEISIDGRKSTIEKYGDSSNDGVVFIKTKGKKSKNKNKSKDKGKDKQKD